MPQMFDDVGEIVEEALRRVRVLRPTADPSRLVALRRR
jgi:hypothetical protein